MILVTGAAGKTGRAVTRALVSRGESVRAAVFRKDQRDEALGLGAREAVEGDLLDPAFLAKAVERVRSVYHICPNIHPQEVKIGRLLVAASLAAGVRHFVYHSVMHPQTEAMPHHWRKLRVEELLFEAGLATTIIQPAAYMQNILAIWDTIEEEDRYVFPYPAETRISMVDLEDVAEAVAIVMIDSGHDWATYELAGPQPLTQSEVCAQLSEKLERSIRAAPITIDRWKRSARSTDTSAYELDTLASMFNYYARYGFVGNPNVLGWLLGRKPSSLADFLDRHISESRSTRGQSDRKAPGRGL